MRVEVYGVNLPGSRWCGYDNIHVGLQRRAEVVQLQSGAAAEVRWEFDMTAVDLDDGVTDLRGPFVRGRRGDRFVYLSWGTVGARGTFTMFRRAKLMLGVDPPVLTAARRPGGSLIARLGLTGGDGGPRCGAVRPPGIGWSAAP